MAVDIRLRLWPGFSASHDLARSPGVRESNPQPTQGFANPGFNFLTVSADLYLAVLVPWIQQVSRALEWQVAPVLPLNEVAASARVGGVVVGGATHAGRQALELRVALEVAAALHREHQHHLFALLESPLHLPVGGRTQGPEARGDGDVHRPLGARLDDVKATSLTRGPLGAGARARVATAGCGQRGGVRPLVRAPRSGTGFRASRSERHSRQTGA